MRARAQGLAALAALAGWSGCAASLPARAMPVLVHAPDAADARVGAYVSSPDGFSTSCYWLEGPDGLVLVDTQFLPSAAAEAADWAEQVTGKRVVLAVVLHANPDKFNGTATLQARGVQVVTSEQVRALIPAVHELRRSWFFERYRPDYPAETPAPETFGKATRTLDAAGLSMKVHVLGPGCSEAHVALEWQGHLFVGDLVANGGHAWLELGRLDDWHARLDELERLGPRWVHPGRGPSGGPELLARQRHYLQRVAALVDQAIAEDPKAPPTDARLALTQHAIEQAFPGLGFTKFVELGLPAVWRARLAKRG